MSLKVKGDALIGYMHDKAHHHKAADAGQRPVLTPTCMRLTLPHTRTHARTHVHACACTNASIDSHEHTYE